MRPKSVGARLLGEALASGLQECHVLDHHGVAGNLCGSAILKLVMRERKGV